MYIPVANLQSGHCHCSTAHDIDEVWVCIAAKEINADLPWVMGRKKDDKKEANQPTVSQLSPPPLPPEPDMLFSDQLNEATIARISSEAGLDASAPIGHQPRIGRGGRLIFDRYDLTFDIRC